MHMLRQKGHLVLPVMIGVLLLVAAALVIHAVTTGNHRTRSDGGGIVSPCNRPLIAYPNLYVTYRVDGASEVKSAVARQGGSIVAENDSDSSAGYGSYTIELGPGKAATLHTLQEDPNVTSITPAGTPC